MAVFDALRHLSDYLRESHPQNHLADLYELVQYAGNIVPRLYLMVTVGTAYMSLPDAPVKEIMKDMMEMSRGVQHPVRGLFLRYYLSGQARDHLPIGNSQGPDGNLQDSIGFILTNFVEMNKLWVRLQHQGPLKERDLRTKERQELQLLVGSNLVRLSQLVDLEAYRTVILTPLLEQVVQCRDVLAQEYLLEVVTQVFPDEYHLHTLDQFLSATARLNPQVHIKKVVIGMMDRLSAYAARETVMDSAEVRKEKEEEALQKLMDRLNIDNHKSIQQESTSNQPKDVTIDQNSKDKVEDKDQETNATATTETADDVQTNSTTESTDKVQTNGTKTQSIPADINLFQIFYQQVINLISLQKLSIQDVAPLLHSLINLAL